MNTDRSLDAAGVRLKHGWTLLLTPPGAFGSPGDLPADAQWIAATVPGTVAGSLTAAGRFDPANPEPLIDRDAWYALTLADHHPGPAILRFDGLATIADVFLDDAPILASRSMFERHEVLVDLKTDSRLCICFRALGPHLQKPGPRARWRPRLINNQGLRLTRATALGFMPGWSPEIHAIGPFRPIRLARPDKGRISDVRVSSTLDGNVGVLKVSLAVEGEGREVRLCCAGHDTLMSVENGRYSAELRIADIAPWWPHTHGTPCLHDVTLTIDGTSRHLARTGFRNVSVDRGADSRDFAIRVNGKAMFCRGAVWTTADILNLPGNQSAYARWLRLAREAGMNMIRIPGIATYETADFFALCDELGILVWQDFMFANFDYPVADNDLMIHVKSEVGQFLADTGGHPSLAILCGGSEIFQQGAMLGLPERIWKTPFCEDMLAGLVAESRPDLPYVANSPSGGAMPFFVNAGVAHYYGVGAYRRPIEDARRANLRFAAECLAFSNLSQHEDLADGKRGIPRDAGADWDFEDIRDHYLGDLYGVDPAALRTADRDRYLALSRAVTGEVMEAAFAEWRRPLSSCNGALVFTLQDVMPGPGWGVIDVAGEPKPAWYALKRAFRPVQLVISDEGSNGLDLHLINETGDDLAVIVEIACLRDGRMPVVSGRAERRLAAQDTVTLAATDLFGAFFDTNYAYRFGPPSHDVTVARLSRADTGQGLAEAFHFPLGRAAALHDATITAMSGQDAEGHWLDLSTDLFAQSVTIAAPGFQASDQGFHLAPGNPRRIRLDAPDGRQQALAGCVQSLGSGRVTSF